MADVEMKSADKPEEEKENMTLDMLDLTPEVTQNEFSFSNTPVKGNSRRDSKDTHNFFTLTQQVPTKPVNLDISELLPPVTPQKTPQQKKKRRSLLGKTLITFSRR